MYHRIHWDVMLGAQLNRLKVFRLCLFGGFAQLIFSLNRWGTKTRIQSRTRRSHPTGLPCLEESLPPVSKFALLPVHLYGRVFRLLQLQCLPRHWVPDAYLILACSPPPMETYIKLSFSCWFCFWLWCMGQKVGVVEVYTWCGPWGQTSLCPCFEGISWMTWGEIHGLKA